MKKIKNKIDRLWNGYSYVHGSPYGRVVGTDSWGLKDWLSRNTRKAFTILRSTLIKIITAVIISVMTIVVLKYLNLLF